jgi:hypothetical protein
MKGQKCLPLCKAEIIQPDVRRALTLVGKVIQNLANEIKEFKEDFMTPLNPFLQANAPRIHEFYEAVSVSISSLETRFLIVNFKGYPSVRTC